MKTNQINYMSSVSIYELPALTASKVEFLKNDVQILSEYGINTEAVKILNTDALALSSLLMDQKYESIQKETTAHKNQIRKQLESHLQYLSIRISISIDEESIAYSRFHLGALSGLTDSQMHSQAVYLHGIITENADLLLKSGISASDINKLQNLISQFLLSISAVKTALQNRRIATAKRHEAARNLYRKLSKICGVARKVYLFIDPVYASRYVLHTSNKSENQSVVNTSEELV